jgi:hypothetical protein
MSVDQLCAMPRVAGDLSVFDCAGVADGSAAAIVVRAEDAHRYTDKPLYVKALSFVAGPASGPMDPSYDYTSFEEVVHSAEDAYAQAGITNPRAERVVAARLVGIAVPGEVGRDDREAVHERGQDRQPRLGAAGHAVDQDQDGAGAPAPVGDVVTVDRDPLRLHGSVIPDGQGATRPRDRRSRRTTPSRPGTRRGCG